MEQAQAQIQQAQQQLQQQQQQLVTAHQQNEQLRQRIAQLEVAANQRAAQDQQAQPAAAPRLPTSSIKAMQPSSFSGGVGVNPEQWLREMERYLGVTGAAPAAWVPFASTYLKGGASVWFNTLERRIQEGEWDEFRAEFMARFSPLDAARVARAALRKLRQRRNVAEYSTAFLKQIELIPDMSVADQLEHYINGLHVRLANEVDRQHPTTLQEAMNAAQREELRQATRQSFGPTSFRPAYFQPRSTYSSGSYSGGDAMDLSLIDQEIDALYAMDEQPSFDSHEHQLNALPHRRPGPNSNGRNFRSSFRQAPSSGSNNGRGVHVPGLTKEEFDRLSRENRCFACKQPGHLARNCSKNSHRSGESNQNNSPSSSNSSK
jgi:hypothetical protein